MYKKYNDTCACGPQPVVCSKHVCLNTRTLCKLVSASPVSPLLCLTQAGKNLGLGYGVQVGGKCRFTPAFKGTLGAAPGYSKPLATLGDLALQGYSRLL